ncbi:uncharacterized protein LOC115382344 [Salarias fasciatus]|uniref:uncharacterized protein LOC115382344 n=1 Tax=Salarias fasciatus TaxID=181472 RepID=UPI0011767079|nr:uncharacterized protein LOC115382344 [Salarias fasciatus]XP_029939943.1 uncharacterized protein LOC115382344 [Salarias fasciatus]
MVDVFVSKQLGLVLIITAQMIFIGQGHEQVNGFIGSSITLQFTFNVNITNTRIGVYFVEKHTKINDNVDCSSCFDIYPHNSTVFYHITNLTKQNKVYYASLLRSELVIDSNKVRLIVQEETKSTTVSQTPTNSVISQDEESSSFFSSHSFILLVVVPAVLLAAALPLLIFCFEKTKVKKQQEQQTSNPTLQETIEVSSLPASSLVYSVLDFPKRPPTVVEMSSSDTDYAVVSCLPEQR